MEFLDSVKSRIPEYVEDVRLNIDKVIARSSLSPRAQWVSLWQRPSRQKAPI